MNEPDTTKTSAPDRVASPAPEEDLPRWLRWTLVFAGIVFLLIGIAMLAIPVLPQVWAFAISAVCFSVASPAVWEWLERKLRRWPRVHHHAETTRSKLVDRFNRAQPNAASEPVDPVQPVEGTATGRGDK